MCNTPSLTTKTFTNRAIIHVKFSMHTRRSKSLIANCINRYDNNTILTEVLADGNRLLTTIRMLSSEINEARCWCHDIVRQASTIKRDSTNVPVDLLTVDDMSRYYNEQGWVSHSGIISVREYYKFTNAKIQYNNKEFKELLWLHGELVSRVYQLHNIYSQLVNVFDIHDNYISENK